MSNGYVGNTPIPKVSVISFSGTLEEITNVLSVPGGVNTGNIRVYINGFRSKESDYRVLNNEVVFDLNFPIGTEYIVEQFATFATFATFDTANTYTKAEVIALINSIAEPVGTVKWWPSTALIPANYIQLNGQEVAIVDAPKLQETIALGKLPATNESSWQSNPVQRGKFVLNSSAGKFRLADYNGKQTGSLGAVFLRGDGFNSAAESGVIQRDKIQNITGSIEIADPNYLIGAFVKDSSSGALKSTIGSGSGKVMSNGAAFTDSNRVTTITFNASNSIETRTGNETNPVNVTGCYAIKFN